MMRSEFFYNLTPDIVMQAIDKSGLVPTGHCLTLNSFENRVYDIMLEDETHVVAKFYRPGRWNEEQILEEHEFLNDLVGGEIPACAPRQFPDGTTLHQIENIYYAIWNRTGGRAADELSDIELSILGRYLARIHNTGQAKESKYRIRLTGETYGIEPCDYLIRNGFLPSHCIDRYRNAVREIVSIYETLCKGVPFHRIHGDCHLGNLLNGRDGWFFLDFDDFLTGPAVQDVWMLVPARDAEGLRQRAVFLEAYRQFRDFDSSWLRLIEPLRALRYIRYAAWIAYRWEDPAFPKAFPHFGTPQYWEDETRDLEEQVEYFHSNTENIPVSIRRDDTVEKEEDNLSNKDFFWDWDEK